jgi:energy-coupling factor transport system ATP-binding protein
VITFDRVTFTYDQANLPVLRDVDLAIPEGELCLIVGPSGSGKSTLLRLINGLVPHFTGGLLEGDVVVDGRSTSAFPPRDLADVVGFVGQDPSAGFVTDLVEDELAYAMESLGLAPDVMRRRVEETLDQLALAPLRRRPLRALSGGERQRVAIGAALTAHPRILVLDEPTSALDPGAAEDVLAHLQRLVHDLGMTVVLAEHRLERVVQYADRVVLVPGAGAPLVVGRPAAVMTHAPVAPPVVELGRWQGWDPLPLTVRDARRAAVHLREQLTMAPPPATGAAATVSPRPPTSTLATLRDLHVGYGRREVLHGVSLDIGRGDVIALMGRNGAGKSTLLSTLVGLRSPYSGSVRVLDADPARLSPRELVARVGLVPQQPGDLLYADTVATECRHADRDAGLVAGTTRDVLHRLAPTIDDDLHPGDLSEGNRLLLALAVVLAPQPPVLLLDEPTRGLDYAAKTRLIEVIGDLAREDHAVVLATHDVELAAEVTTRTVVLGEGVVVADGDSLDIVTASPMFAPQMAKVLAPHRVLTLTQVRERLGVAP